MAETRDQLTASAGTSDARELPAGTGAEPGHATGNHTDPLDELLTCRLDSGEKRVAPCSVVIFGASGDLTARKLMPALYHLFAAGRLPSPFRIVGFARREKTEATWREEMRTAVQQALSGQAQAAANWDAFAPNLSYCQGDLNDPASYRRLATGLSGFDHEGLRQNLLFYLATQPSQFAAVAERLAEAGLLRRDDGSGFSPRLVIEKPFGKDLRSAQALNASLTRHAHEHQILRIDHYLGKETIQNILMFRFSNAIFEHLWNRHLVDHVQITMSEQVPVGSRGGFYEETGALRDVVQNHLLQVLALVAMEPPVSLDAEAIRDEKVKLLNSVRPLDPSTVASDAVRGQYGAGTVAGEPRVAYRAEPKVDPQSAVETFVALRLFIDNWRWAGVPFYLRSGKNLPVAASEVRLQFRSPPQVLFAAQCGPRLDANSLTLRLQPNEGISLRFNGKIPGSSMRIRPVRMHFQYEVEFGAYTSGAYERLLLEAMAGDRTLFIRRDEVEAAWRLIDPIRAGWERSSLAEDEFYAAGTWGPPRANALLAATGHAWRNPMSVS